MQYQIFAELIWIAERLFFSIWGMILLPVLYQ